MSFKIFLVAALIAVVRAGGPAAYSIVAPSGDHHSVGSVHEHTVKGPHGLNSVSEYTKTDDSDHSSVRVSSSSVTNSHGHGAAVIGHAAPLVTSHGLGYAHAAPALAIGHGPAVLGHGLALGHGLGVGHGLALGGHGLALGAGHGVALGHGAVIGHGLVGPSITHHGLLSAPAVHNGLVAGSLGVAHGAVLGHGIAGHGLIGHPAGLVGHGLALNRAPLGAIGVGPYGHGAIGVGAYGHGAPVVHSSIVGHGVASNYGW